MKENQNEIIEENENNIDNEGKNKSDDNIKLVKVNSSKLLVKIKGSKDDSFEIISKNKEFQDDFGFSETSFKTVYENDPLLSHVITHTNNYIEKNKHNSEDIAHLSDFISFDEISRNNKYDINKRNSRDIDMFKTFNLEILNRLLSFK